MEKKMNGQSSREKEGNLPPRVNFFRPTTSYLAREMFLIWIMLAGWALLTFGFQGLLAVTGDSSGSGPLTQSTLFGFPLHFWFSGQFLILWFVFLCFLFNFFIDRLISRYRKPRQGG